MSTVGRRSLEGQADRVAETIPTIGSVIDEKNSMVVCTDPAAPLLKSTFAAIRRQIMRSKERLPSKADDGRSKVRAAFGRPILLQSRGFS